MAAIKTIRDAIKTRIEAIGAVTNLGHLTVYDTMPAIPAVPCAIIAPAPGVFLSEVTLEQSEDLSLVVTVLVQKIVEAVAQDIADTYLSEGAPNIADAIESGKTANWDFVMCGSIRGYGQYTIGDGESATRYLGFEIPVTVAVP